MIEIIYFPKMCCGQPITVVKKFSSGNGFMQCSVSGEFPEVCKKQKGFQDEES